MCFVCFCLALFSFCFVLPLVVTSAQFQKEQQLNQHSTKIFLDFRNLKRKQFIKKTAVWKHTLVGMLMIKMTDDDDDVGGGDVVG